MLWVCFSVRSDLSEEFKWGMTLPAPSSSPFSNLSDIDAFQEGLLYLPFNFMVILLSQVWFGEELIWGMTPSPSPPPLWNLLLIVSALPVSLLCKSLISWLFSSQAWCEGRIYVRNDSPLPHPLSNLLSNASAFQVGVVYLLFTFLVMPSSQIWCGGGIILDMTHPPPLPISNYCQLPVPFQLDLFGSLKLGR